MNEGEVQRAISRKDRKMAKPIYKGQNGLGIRVFECSRCKHDIYGSGNFCPNCGYKFEKGTQ